MSNTSDFKSHVRKIERVDLSIFPNENPFRIDDEEFSVLDDLYGRMVHWKANHVATRNRVFDMQMDISQDIFIQLVHGASLYKRQKFIVGCMEWAMKYPERIPVDHLEKFWASLYCYQVREKLGPRHGFKPEYEQYVSDAMDAIDAPIDFEFSPLSQVFQCLRNHVDEIDNGDTQSQCKVFLESEERVLQGTMPRSQLRHLRQEAMRLEPIQKTIFDCDSKPCRYRPLDLDEHFKPYITQFVMNESHKSSKKIGRHERFNAGAVNLDEYGSFLPDMRPESLDFLDGRRQGMIMSHVHHDSESKSIRTFEHVEDVDRKSPVFSFAFIQFHINALVKGMSSPMVTA